MTQVCDQEISSCVRVVDTSRLIEEGDQLPSMRVCSRQVGLHICTDDENRWGSAHLILSYLLWLMMLVVNMSHNPCASMEPHRNLRSRCPVKSWREGITV